MPLAWSSTDGIGAFHERPSARSFSQNWADLIETRVVSSGGRYGELLLRELHVKGQTLGPLVRVPRLEHPSRDLKRGERARTPEAPARLIARGIIRGMRRSEQA